MERYFKQKKLPIPPLLLLSGKKIGKNRKDLCICFASTESILHKREVIVLKGKQEESERILPILFLSYCWGERFC